MRAFVNLKKNIVFIVIIILIFENVTYICLNRKKLNVLHEAIKEEVIAQKEEHYINYGWKLEIPEINLLADIEDGTTDEILNRNIGHFEMTGYSQGNIALAAHNRGYKVNYFSNLKDLEIGDEIIYYYNEFKKVFILSEMKIIKDTDVEVLDDTDENIITLITCVENMPEYRRCIVGKVN